jgi:DNA-binding MarR family transcriptional regulator
MRSSKNSSLPTPIDSPDRRRLPLLLRHSWYGLNQAFRRRIAHLGITPDQFTVLRTLIESDRKGLTQRDLAEKMCSDPNTVASLLERMESAKLLERVSHEDDRRAHRIRLLPLGQKDYLAAREIAVVLQGEILEALPEKNRNQFLVELELVAGACKEVADKSPRKKRRPAADS